MCSIQSLRSRLSKDDHNEHGNCSWLPPKHGIETPVQESFRLPFDGELWGKDLPFPPIIFGGRRSCESPPLTMPDPMLTPLDFLGEGAALSRQFLVVSHSFSRRAASQLSKQNTIDKTFSNCSIDFTRQSTSKDRTRTGKFPIAFL